MSPDNVAYIAIELSVTSWLVAARLPGAEKPRLHRIEGGDTAALLALIAELRSRASAKGGRLAKVVCCFEAGRDGFWLHRLLEAHDITTHILEPTSILVNCRARRAKTDRLDAEGMLRVLVAWLGGDRQVCSMVRVPTPNEEDAKRPHREREISSKRGCASRTGSRLCCLRRESEEDRRYACNSSTHRSAPWLE